MFLSGATDLHNWILPGHSAPSKTMTSIRSIKLHHYDDQTTPFGNDFCWSQGRTARSAVKKKSPAQLPLHSLCSTLPIESCFRSSHLRVVMEMKFVSIGHQLETSTKPLPSYPKISNNVMLHSVFTSTKAADLCRWRSIYFGYYTRSMHVQKRAKLENTRFTNIRSSLTVIHSNE